MAKCGGCEAKVPEAVGDGPFPEFDPADEGSYSREYYNAPDFTGAAGGDLYSAYALELTADLANGECNAACVQVTSCSYVVTITLEGHVISDHASASGPGLLFTPPAGMAAIPGEPTAMTRTTWPISYDPETGLYIVGIFWSIDATVTPGCGTDVTVTITDSNFAIDTVATGSWTKSPGEFNEPSQAKFGCFACDTAKLASSDQASGKNQNEASIDTTTLAGLQAAESALADDAKANDCTGCGWRRIEHWRADDDGVYSWDPMGILAVGEGFGGSDGGGQSYVIDSVLVLPDDRWYSGRCKEDAYGDCATDYSCKHSIRVKLSGSFTSPVEDWDGPNFGHRRPPGWTPVFGPEATPTLHATPGQVKTPGVQLQDPPFSAIYTTPCVWEWYYTFEPGCGQTIESSVKAADFVLSAPEFSTFTNVPTHAITDPLGIIRLRMSCTACKKAEVTSPPTGPPTSGPITPGGLPG
jgi:hypothetical protein